MEPTQKTKPATYIVFPKPNLKGLSNSPVRIIKGLGKINHAYLTPLSIIIAGAMIAGSIMVTGGAFLIKNKASNNTNVPSAANPQPNNPAAPNAPTVSPDKIDKVTAEDHVRGDRSARYQLIEYSDLECPFCKSFHPTAQKILSDYQGKIAWVYRHFPLDPIHSKADKEAEAAECAAEQGGNDAFWKFVDKVFEVTPSNNGLDPAQLPQIATQVGLDGTKLKSCLDSGKMAQKVESQYQSGIKVGVSGTPTSVILDTQTNKASLIPGALPYEQIKSQLDSMINGPQK